MTEADLQLLLDEVASRLDVQDPTPRRLFHGRGHCFEGLTDVVLERYGPVLLLTLHGARPAAWLAALAAALRELDGGAGALRSLVLQRRDQHRAPSQLLWGEAVDELVVREAGLDFLVRPGMYQNPGLFLDMTGARSWVREVAEGARVLNLFAYTCAFSVAAVAGGAAQVLNVDMSRAALRIGQRNHALNGHEPRRTTALTHDILRSFARLTRLGPWDLIIVDPPTLQRGSFVARTDYVRLARRLERLCAPGATLLTCLNAPTLDAGFLHEVVTVGAPSLATAGALEAGEDFPEREASRGLKMQLWRAP